MANLPFLDLEQRTGIRGKDIDDFLAKVNAVDDAIKGIKEGKIDPNTEIRIPGVLTESEKRRIEEEQKKEEARRIRLEKERKERKKKEEREKWWDGAELVFGTKEDRARQEKEGKVDAQKDKAKALSVRYNNDYSRWNGWVPDDPVTQEEEKLAQDEKERKDNEIFEKANAEFCEQVKEDMKTREEARQQKEESANTLRLKGNRFFKAKQFDKALLYYMDSLKASQFKVETLTNIAQVYLRLQQYDDAIEFCHRALHVCPSHIKALSRRAQAYTSRGEPAMALPDLDKALGLEGGRENEDLVRQHREVKQIVEDSQAEEAVASVRAHLQEDAMPEDVEGLARMVEEGGLESVEAMALASIDHIMKALAQGRMAGLRLLAPLVASSSSHAVYLRTSGALSKLCALAVKAAEGPAGQAPKVMPEDEELNISETQWLLSVLSAAVEEEVRSRLMLLREGTLKVLFKSYLPLPSERKPDHADEEGNALAEMTLRILASCVGTEECLVTVACDAAVIDSLLYHVTTLGVKDEIMERSAALLRELVIRPEGRKTVLKLKAERQGFERRQVVQAVGRQLSTTRSYKPARQSLTVLLTALAAMPELRLDFIGTTDEALLNLCRGTLDASETRAMALGALMNAGLDETGQVKEDLIRLGTVELTASLVGANESLRARLKSEDLWVRAAGLLSRLATRPSGRERIRNTAGAVQMLVRGVCSCSRPTSAQGDGPPTAANDDERSHLVRTLANVMDDNNAHSIMTPDLVRSLVKTLPEPRRDGGVVTAESVTLAPPRKVPYDLGVSVTKCLMCVADKEGKAPAQLLEAFVAEEGIERLIAAFANTSDGPLRKNIASGLARLVKGGGAQAERIRALRFMEMMVQLGSRLLE